MGLISLEVYNSVYNITEQNDTLQIVNNQVSEDQKLINAI